MVNLILSHVMIAVAGVLLGILIRTEFKRWLKRPQTCRWSSTCGGLIKITCGSGYCAQHCGVFCDDECIDPMLCTNCEEPVHRHAPGKCLFEPTTYQPMRKNVS